MAITISGENNNDKILASDGVIDQISGTNFSGITTASHINVGSNIQIGNAGIITATTLLGNVTGNVNHTSNLLLQISGSEKFRVGNGGQFGIAGANYGTAGQVFTSGGSGSAPSWSTITQTTISGNANNRVITGSGTANTLNGESTLTYDGDGLLSMTSTSGSAEFTLVGPNNTDSGIYFNDGANDGAISYDHSARQLKFRAGGHTRMYFAGGNDNNNNVVYLANNSYDDGILQYYNGGLYFKTGSSNGDRLISFHTAGTQRLLLDSNGALFLHGNNATSANNSTTRLPNGYTFNIAGNSSNDGISIVRYSSGYGAYALNIGRSRNNTVGTNTAVANGDELGHISFYGANGSGFSYAAQITAVVEGEVGTGGDSSDMPGALSFKTTPNGEGTSTEKLRIKPDGTINITTANGNLEWTASSGSNPFIRSIGSGQQELEFNTGGDERLRIKSNGNALFGGTAVSQTNRSLVVGSNAEANLAIETHNTSASETANIRFYRSRGTAASPTTLVDGDVLSQLMFYAHDGNDYAHQAAMIRVKCNGTVASNNVPGEILFYTNPGSQSANLAMTITKERHVLFSGLDTYRDPRNVTGITVKSTGGLSFQNYGSNGSRNWRIRPDDMSRWGDLDFMVSPTANSSTDWPDAAADRVLALGYDKNVFIPNGNLVIGTAGKGIDFSAQSPSSASGASTGDELLDHYEEGTWTPTAYGFTISSTYSARYTRIGRVCHVNCYVRSATGSGTSQQPHIGGLPFTSRSGDTYSYGAGRIGNGGHNNAAYDITFQVQTNSTNVKLYVGDGGINESMMSNTHVIFSVVYEVA
jgi:hypothetical protein